MQNIYLDIVTFFSGSQEILLSCPLSLQLLLVLRSAFSSCVHMTEVAYSQVYI